MTSHGADYFFTRGTPLLPKYVPNVLTLRGECPPATHVLTPHQIPPEYLQLLIENMREQLLRVTPFNDDMLSLMGGGRRGDRRLKVRFELAHTLYAKKLCDLVHEALGVSKSVICLVLTYLNQDPVCVHCETVVERRCACNNGIHFDGTDKKLPCARQVAFVPVTETTTAADNDGLVVEVKPQDDECVDCLARKEVCGVCNKLRNDSDPIIHCMYPGCTSTTHKDCPMFDGDFENNTDWVLLTDDDDDDDDNGDVKYACPQHDVATALELILCGECDKYEFSSNEILDPRHYGPCSNKSSGWKNKFARCALCDAAFHVGCSPFFDTCMQCLEEKQMCYHPVDNLMLICEGCYEKNNTNTCVYCEDGVEAFPSTNRVDHCDTCDKIYHDKCGGTHTVDIGGWKHSYCDDCWSDLPSTEQEEETLQENARRRSLIRSKALGRVFPAVNLLAWLYFVPIIAQHIATDVPTLSELLPLLPDVLLFHFYMPWNLFDRKAQVNHATALKAGVALPPQHCEDDVRTLMRKHLAHFFGIDMEPWKAGTSCDAWRASVKLDGM
jgi:hypothetical protein